MIIDDRYKRMRSIFPTEPLQKALAIVGGCGALGNEVIKNLTLLGVGTVLVCDFDKVEIHNLTRSVLFRQEDTGKYKADVAVKEIENINPDINAIPFSDSIFELGHGFFRRANLVFSTFDAHFPRYVINEACLRFRKPWVDGGMSALVHTKGGITVYDCSDPSAFCYSCNHSPEVVRTRIGAMTAHVGCTVYENLTGEMGGVPTTPMMSSVIGGVQVSAALDVFYNHLNPDFESKWPFGSWELDIKELRQRTIAKRKRDDCHHHSVIEPMTKIIEVPEWNSAQTTYRNILERAAEDLATDRVSIHLPEILYADIRCTACGQESPFFRYKSTFTIRSKNLSCEKCGGTDHEVDGLNQTQLIDMDWEYLDKPIGEVGGRPLDILEIVKADTDGIPESYKHYEITGDAARFGLDDSQNSDTLPDSSKKGL